MFVAAPKPSGAERGQRVAQTAAPQNGRRADGWRAGLAPGDEFGLEDDGEVKMQLRPHASPTTKGYGLRRWSRRLMTTLPFFLASVAFAAVPAMPLLFLFWLMQPTVFANPGMSTYHAPPATRLEPLPRKMDLLEFGEPSDLISLSNPARNYTRPYVAHGDVVDAYAQQEETERPTKRQARVSYAKRSKSAQGHKRHQPSYTYALQ